MQHHRIAAAARQFPVRVGGLKFVERGASPQSARILGIRPVIVDQAAAPGDVGEIVGPVEYGRKHVAIGGEGCVTETRQSAGILFLDPVLRLLAFDLFQP